MKIDIRVVGIGAVEEYHRTRIELLIHLRENSSSRSGSGRSGRGSGAGGRDRTSVHHSGQLWCRKVKRESRKKHLSLHFILLVYAFPLFTFFYRIYLWVAYGLATGSLRVHW